MAVPTAPVPVSAIDAESPRSQEIFKDGHMRLGVTKWQTALVHHLIGGLRSGCRSLMVREDPIGCTLPWTSRHARYTNVSNAQ